MKTLNWPAIDKALNVLFSFGAAVVIFGATAKILHWNNADTYIMIGLLTEVLIFTVMGIVEMKKPTEKQKQETASYHESDNSVPYSLPKLPDMDKVDEIIVFRHNLERMNENMDKLNQMMTNILNSAKH